MQFYCPACFAEIEHQVTVCPVCGTDIAMGEARLTYTERLVYALQHPNMKFQLRRQA